MNIMTKEEAKAELRKTERDLRLVNAILENPEQGIREFEDKIADLQAIINKPDRWQDLLMKPENERYFYLIGSADEGLVVDWYWEDIRKPEHTFKTEEQAELIKEKTLLIWEMHAFAHVRNEGWMPDWQDEGQKRYGIALEGDKIQLFRLTYVNSFVFGVTVKSREIAEEMLEIFGERIEKFYNKMY